MGREGGVQRSWDLSTPSPSVVVLRPRSTYGLSGGSKMRNTPVPTLLPSRYSKLGDVRVLVDRRTVVKRNHPGKKNSICCECQRTIV